MIKHKYGRTETSLPTEIIELLNNQVSKELVCSILDPFEFYDEKDSPIALKLIDKHILLDEK
ncbi:MAG: hypothetical protein ACFNVP_00740 [Capnocytophaga ochracea]|jgi:hypothetical protein